MVKSHLRGELVLTLTPREIEVLQTAACGAGHLEIGEILGISEHTVNNHMRAIRLKLHVRTRIEAVMEGLRLGIISFDLIPKRAAKEDDYVCFPLPRAGAEP